MTDTYVRRQLRNYLVAERERCHAAMTEARRFPNDVRYATHWLEVAERHVFKAAGAVMLAASLGLFKNLGCRTNLYNWIVLGWPGKCRRLPDGSWEDSEEPCT